MKKVLLWLPLRLESFNLTITFFLMKEGNPFKPFWDELEVDFDEKIVYHLGTHVQDPYERDKWQMEYVLSLLC